MGSWLCSFTLLLAIIAVKKTLVDYDRTRVIARSLKIVKGPHKSPMSI